MKAWTRAAGLVYNFAFERIFCHKGPFINYVTQEWERGGSKNADFCAKETVFTITL